MPNYISLLRGINVSGQRKIKMQELKTCYEKLNLKNVTTYIQSGNVVFTSDETDKKALCSTIEQAIQQEFGHDVSVFIKTADELQQIIDNTPFSNYDITKCHVTFLEKSAEKQLVDEIEKAKAENEEFKISGDIIYLYCPNGYGRTKLNNSFFERKTKAAATTRNWKTSCKLLSLSKPDSD